jgi:hypothetical protein
MNSRTKANSRPSRQAEQAQQSEPAIRARKFGLTERRMHQIKRSILRKLTRRIWAENGLGANTGSMRKDFAKEVLRKIDPATLVLRAVNHNQKTTTANQNG